MTKLSDIEVNPPSSQFAAFMRLESASTSVFVKGLDGEILFANKVFYDSFVRQPTASPGKLLNYAALPTDLQEISRFTDEHIINRKIVMNFTHLIQTLSGNRKRYFTTKVPILAADGSVDVIFGTSVELRTDSTDLESSAPDINGLRQAKALLEKISPKSVQVLVLVCRGMTNKRVANVLDISERSVERIRGEAMKALKVTSFARLVNTLAPLRQMRMFDAHHWL